MKTLGRVGLLTLQCWIIVGASSIGQMLRLPQRWALGLASRGSAIECELREIAARMTEPLTAPVYCVDSVWRESIGGRSTIARATFNQLLPVGSAVDCAPRRIWIEGPDLDPELVRPGKFEIIIRRLVTDA